METCPSGWRSTPGKCVYGKPYRGFESLSLRQVPMHHDAKICKSLMNRILHFLCVASSHKEMHHSGVLSETRSDKYRIVFFALFCFTLHLKNVLRWLNFNHLKNSFNTAKRMMSITFWNHEAESLAGNSSRFSASDTIVCICNKGRNVHKLLLKPFRQWVSSMFFI